MSLCVIVLTALCFADAPPGDPVPPLLLSAPVNATHTANHAAAYRALGLQGFVFRGIIDGLGREYCGLSGDWPAFWKGDPRFQEIALAVRRLAAEGMGENFLRLPLAPEQAWFTDRAYFKEGVDTFVYAAAFARAAGMKGLAIDLRDCGSLFDLRWSAYRLDESGVQLALRKAEEFGRSAALAALRMYPKAHLLLITLDAQMYSRVWTAFVDGLCAGAAASGGARVIAVIDPATLGNNEEEAEQIARGLLGHLSPSALEQIEEHGGVSPLVRLRGQDDCRRVALAQTRARGYAVTEAEWSSLVPVSAEEAAEFAHLRQGGDARVAATKGSGLPLVSLASARPGMRRMGTAYLEGNPVYVFAGNEGAALLAPQGFRAPITLRHRVTPLRVHDLESGKTAWFPPKEGEITVPDAGPCFIEPLDHETWSLPASLRLDFRATAEEGALRLPVLIQCANPAPAPMAGLLDVALPTGLSLGTQPLRATLGPGARFSAQRHLQGVVRAGERFALSLNWFLDAGATTHRDITFEVSPRELWRVRMDGPLLSRGDGMAILAGTHGEGGRILAASSAGDYAMVDSTGSLRWRSRFRAAVSVAPLIAPGTEKPCVMAQSAANRVSLLDAETGTQQKQIELAHPLSSMTMISPNDAGALAVIALTTGALVAVNSELVPQWNARVTEASEGGEVEGRCLLASAKTSGIVGAVYVPGEGARPYLACLDRDGKVLARARLPRMPAESGPFFVEQPGNLALVQPLVEGALFVLAASGHGSDLLAPETTTTPQAAGALYRSGASLFFVADTLGVRRLDVTGKVFGDMPISAVLGLSETQAMGEEVVIAAGREGLIAFDWNHRLLWRDARVPGGCAGPVWTGDLEGDGRMECLYAAMDGTLRCVALGPGEKPPRAGQGLPRRSAP